MQMFQAFMQKQAAEKQQFQQPSRKRMMPTDGSNTAYRSLKLGTRAEWPPRGTGPPRLTGAAGVEQVEIAAAIDNSVDQQYGESAGVVEDYSIEGEDTDTYFQGDGEGYTSEYY